MAFNLFGPRLSRNEKILLYQSLGFMLSSGVSVYDAAKMLRDDPSKAIKPAALDIILDGIQNGLQLSEVIRDNPMFGDYSKQLEIAEQTGKERDCLERIANQIQQGSNLQGKVRNALVMPALTLVLALGVGIWAVNSLVPQMANMLMETGGEMPGVTKFLMGIREHLAANWFLDIVVAAIVVAVGTYLVKGPLKIQCHQLLTKIKVTASVSINVNYAQMYILLNDMLTNGSSVVEALRVAASSLTNKYIELQLNQCADQMESEGTSLGDGLQNVSTMPSQDRMLVKVGCDTGRQTEVLQQMAEHRALVANLTADNLTQIISPIATIILGVIVGVIAMAIYAPILSITESI